MASSARIEELKKKFDENPRRYFAPLANEFRKTGDYDQAILICQEFLPQQPGHMSGHIVFGQALFEAGRLDEARSVFETALTLDPENLIALKHLGDISRAGDDIEGARGWYRRVLDADPRNEEIASILASLDEPASVAWTSPTPKSTASVTTNEGAQAPPAASAAAERANENPLETATSESALPDFDAMMSEAKAASSTRDSGSSESDSDLIELEDTDLSFDASRRPPNDDLGVERAVETPMGFESMTAEPPKDASSFPTLDGLESTSFTPPESAAPQARSAPEPSARQREVSSTAETPTASLEHFELASSHETPGAHAPTDHTEEPGQHRHARASSHRDEASAASSRTAPSGFVTETMAELYVQQGHMGEAVAVYQQLVERYPGDEVLRARLNELEATLGEALAGAAPVEDIAAGGDDESVSPPDDAVDRTFAANARVESAAPATDTPTIREFLNAIASLRPTAPAHDGSPATASEDIAEDFSEAPGVEESYETVPSGDEAAHGEAAPDEPETLGSYAAPSEEVTKEPETAADDFADEAEQPARDVASVGGSIDALFTGAEASDADEEAASRLADAFSKEEKAEEEEKEQQPIVGQPARRAQDELSLDHVFRERSNAGERTQPAFSFDQFFSQSATERTSNAPADQPGTPSGSPDDDIQQFNAWLEGLKKT
jgi:tetratricopeptide (TPR) repeat protein